MIPEITIESKTPYNFFEVKRHGIVVCTVPYNNDRMNFATEFLKHIERVLINMDNLYKKGDTFYYNWEFNKPLTVDFCVENGVVATNERFYSYESISKDKH